MDWETEPHDVDPVIAVAVEHVESLLQLRQNYTDTGIQLTPIISRRDVELAGFDLDDVMAAYRMEAQ